MCRGLRSSGAGEGGVGVRGREGLAERDIVLELLQTADDLREALADGLEDLHLVGQEVQRRHCFVGRGGFARSSNARLSVDSRSDGVRSRALWCPPLLLEIFRGGGLVGRASGGVSRELPCAVPSLRCCSWEALERVLLRWAPLWSRRTWSTSARKFRTPPLSHAVAQEQ